MHHRPVGPPLSARLAGAATRTWLRADAALSRRLGRLGLAVVLLSLMTGFVLAAPVVSGADSPSDVALDATSARLPVAADAPAPGAAVPDASEVPVAPVPPAPAPAETPAAPDPAVPEQPEAPEAPTPAPTTQAGAAAPPPPAAAGRAEQVLALVNQERAAAGCRPLGADSGLAAVAAAHSADMRDRGYFDHVNLDGMSPFDRADAAGVDARAENIARGQRDAAAVMESWMNSPGHRANILDCSLTRLGVGIADGGGGPWWTQLFG